MNSEELIEKRDYMKYLIDTEQDDYMVRNLYNLYDLSIKVGQLDIPKEITPCKRVLQIKRMLPVEILRLSHPELIVWEGVYMVVDGIAIPKDIMKSIGYYKKGYIDYENNYVGLPSGYNYGTLKDVGLGYGFALKNQDLTMYLDNSSGWEFFNLVTEMN